MPGDPYWLNEKQIAERGARMARRDDREYRQYLSKQQRSQPGCPASEVVLDRLIQATSGRSLVRCVRSLVIVFALLAYALPARSQALFEPNTGDTLELLQPTAPVPAEPAHTGFKALVFETGSDFKAFSRRQSTWVILGIGAGAAALVHPLDDNLNNELTGSKAVGRFFAAGKWIGSFYVQTGTAVGLYMVGRYIMPHADGAPRTNRVSHLGFDMMRALIVSQALTQGIKVVAQRDRPTGECCAFPSGHASVTFATASVIERHFGYRASWPMFLIAGYVSASRLTDNRHYLSDVLFGSALGIASGWTVVGRHGRDDYALMATPLKGGMRVSLTYRPRDRSHAAN